MSQNLTVKRQTLIETLQANLDAEKAKRQAAEDALKARRTKAEAAVASLSADELLNLVTKWVSQDLDEVVKMVEEAHESGRLKSPEIQKTPKETSLEKFVRVLTLAQNDTYEVEPTDEVYNLL